MGSKTAVRRVVDERPQVMRAKTVKRLAILIVVIASMTAGGYFLWQFQVARKAHGVVARADQAAEKGDFVRAGELYLQHLAVMPNDMEVRLKYADVSVKADRSQKRLQEAMQTYEDIIRQFPQRTDVRRRAAETASEIGGGMSAERARDLLKSLLETAGDDGHLEYLMAQCHERDGEFDRAAEYYGAAIEHGAPERLEAAQQRAMLLRDKLKKPAEADRVIDAMVKSAPEDYRVYLGRGRYRSRVYLGWERYLNRTDGQGGGDDFRKALKLAPDRVDVYLEVARAAELEPGLDAARRLDAARQVLEKGLAAAPKALELYLTLANLEQRAGRVDRAVEALELGLKAMPDEVRLRVQLAILLANRGDTGGLLLQIDELERVSFSRPFTQYLRAYYNFNKHEFYQARQILTPLQPDVAAIPVLKSMVNLLLSRCHGELSEPEMQWEATLRALSVNPKDMTVRRNWIQALIGRGDPASLDEAIREYRGLYAEQPGAVRMQLASVLLDRNRRLPPAQRRWDEAERLIDEATAASPGSPEPVLLRAQLLLDQDQEDKALDVLETARVKFPKHPGPWTAQADILIRQKKYDDARAMLDRAGQQFGDRVDLRLLRARLVVARGGPQVVAALNEQAQGIESFSREDRRKLLTELAAELARQQDLAGATRAWSRLVELEPERLLPRFQLFDLAIQSKDPEQAAAQIEAIAKLDEQFGQFCRAQLLIWQSKGAADPVDKEKKRATARALLGELKGRRPDWPRVPLALARLSELELEEAGPDEAQKREKLEAAINAYRRAIELGLRDPGIVRHVVELLFRAGRGSEALEVYSQIPALVQLTGDLGRRASQIALANRDFRQAEELARRAIEASPQDFQARVWLAYVLLEGHRPDEAEAEIRKAIAADKADPQRWITLVRFAVMTRDAPKAEKAVEDAEASLAKAPLALAQCCQMVGNAYTAVDAGRARSWFDRARRWFGKAQDDLKDPNDLTVKRRLAEFLLQANQVAEAEGVFKEILARAADGRSPELAAWARRSLGQVYALATPPRTVEALALFAGKEGGAGADADDLRVLALIHEVQGTPEGRRQSIGDLEALIGRGSAGPEDRRRLAQLLVAAGEWTRAREQFRELILRTDGARDTETIALRPRYIALFAEALITHHRPGDDSDLADARQLAGKLKAIPSEAINAVILEARIDKAANQLDAANTRLRDLAGQPGLTVLGRTRLATLAEHYGLDGAAESILRGIAAQPPADPNRFLLALFLSRHGRVKEAVDICEGLWANPAIRERLAPLCIDIVGNYKMPRDDVQVRRVLAWIEAALRENPQSLMYLTGLGNLYERLGDYPRAEEFYGRAVQINDRDGVASNNLAWLIVLQHGKSDKALELINKAIGLKGPVPEYLDTRGMIYLTAGQGELALADLESALKVAPTAPKYFHLAQAYLQLKQVEKARKSLEDGKTRGLPGGLHPLELVVYKEVASKLGMP
jgi:cellulose synthase operon protein C